MFSRKIKILTSADLKTPRRWAGERFAIRCFKYQSNRECFVLKLQVCTKLNNSVYLYRNLRGNKSKKLTIGNNPKIETTFYQTQIFNLVSFDQEFCFVYKSEIRRSSKPRHLVFVKYKDRIAEKKSIHLFCKDKFKKK